MKITYTFIMKVLPALLAALCWTSCSDFLEEDPKGQLPSDTYFSNKEDLDASLTALSYRIPRRVLKFASVQLSVSAQDLFTITRYKGMDPEVYTSYDGLDYGAYPIPRTITFGAKIRF